MQIKNDRKPGQVKFKDLPVGAAFEYGSGEIYMKIDGEYTNEGTVFITGSDGTARIPARIVCLRRGRVYTMSEDALVTPYPDACVLTSNMEPSNA